MVTEVGLFVLVAVLVGGLSLRRTPTVRVVAGAVLTTAAAVVVHLDTGWTGWSTGGGSEWWPEVYTLGGLYTGGVHHDVYGVGLICLGVAALSLGGANCAGWNTHEYVGLLALLLASSWVTLLNDHLGVLYLSLELQALTAYTLVGYYRVKVVTTESALKYLLVGSAVSGFLLVGVFGLYHGSGTFHTGELHFDLLNGTPWLVAALLFKVGAAPFHFWAPAVYESVEWPTLVALVSYSKLNLWVLLGGILSPFVDPGWWILAVAGVVGVVIGGAGGLYQTSVGGVLGYSSVLNSGYLLLLVTTGVGGAPLFLYLFVYSVVAALAGLILSYGVGHLSQRAVPGLWWGVALYYLGLNLGGLPVYPGFFTKLYLLWSLLNPVGVTLVAGVVVVFSVLAVWYYLEVVSNFLLDAGPQADSEYTSAGPVGVLLLSGLVLPCLVQVFILPM